MKSSIEMTASDIEKQKEWADKIREISKSHPTKPLAYTDTYGCQQNESDSEKLRGMLIDMGYNITQDEFEADVAIINTCAVRENAQNRVLGNVGALVHTKKAKKSQIIVFCGCLAAVPETVEKVRNSYEHVRLVFPPNQLYRFPELLYKAMTAKKRVFAEDCEHAFIAEDIPLHRDNTVKAWLPIMYGCNNFCTYCIVPFVRGRERSRRLEKILEEARELVAKGYKDITLLGQNVNSYKMHSASNQSEKRCVTATDSLNAVCCEPGGGFPDLIRKINDIEGDFLIRFMTSHPKDASTELFRAMAECEKVARHIHLPFQAGSDRILKLMNRGYTADEYLEKLEIARELMPDIVITSDVIVGFPGETEEEFNDTLKLVKEADFEAMFTFIYSKRPGTPAAKLDDPVSREDKQIWFEKLVELQNEISERKHARYVGKEITVLIDGTAPKEAYPLKARTNGGRLVHLKGDADLVGHFEKAKITHSNNWSLFGER